MKKILKYIILLTPILIVLDIKIPVSGSFNIGIKEILFIVLIMFIIRTRSLYLLLSNKILQLFFLFVLISVFNNIITNGVVNAPEELLRILEGFILSIGVYYFLVHFSAISLYKSIVLSGLVLSCQIFLSEIFDFDISRTLGGIAGMWLSISIITLIFNFRKFRWPSYFNIILFLVLSVANFLGDKRTWIFITLLFLGFKFFRKLNEKKIILIAFSVVALLFASDFFLNPFLENKRIMDLIPALIDMDLNSIMSSRLYRWEVSKDLIQNNWWTGVGYGNVDLNLASWIKSDNPDNLYLEIWLQNGFLPFLIFCLLLFRGMFIGSSIFDSNFLRYCFALLLLGGITWSFMTGFGILVFSIMVGVASYNYALLKLEKKNNFVNG